MAGADSTGFGGVTLTSAGRLLRQTISSAKDIIENAVRSRCDYACGMPMGTGQMASKKTVVVDYLWDVLTEEGRRVATFDDVGAAIRYCNEKFGNNLKADNPANFMKDLLRGGNASANWPARLSANRITGRQVTGEGRIFEFIPFEEGQEEAFPNPFEPTGDEAEFVIQSVSIPLTTKSLGRQDESWLIQVAVQLRVLETHFASLSPLRVLELTHLQTGIKLNRTEIDSLFLAVLQDEYGEPFNAIVTCEAKQQKDPILADQIVQQVASAYASVKKLDMRISLVIPTALKSLKGRAAIYVAEFEPWTPEEAEVDETNRKDLVVGCSGVYRLHPPVPGIGFNPTKLRRSTKKPAI